MTIEYNNQALPLIVVVADPTLPFFSSVKTKKKQTRKADGETLHTSIVGEDNLLPPSFLFPRLATHLWHLLRINVVVKQLQNTSDQNVVIFECKGLDLGVLM